jgi:hypothetical protein
MAAVQPVGPLVAQQTEAGTRPTAAVASKDEKIVGQNEHHEGELKFGYD